MSSEYLQSQSTSGGEAAIAVEHRIYPADLADFVEHASIGVILIEPNGRIRWANPAEYQRLGLSREDVIGRPYTELFCNREEGEAVLRRLLDGEALRDFEISLRHRDGATRVVAIDGEAVWRGKDSHVRLLTKDITERKLATEKIHLQANMLDAVGQAVIATNVEGRISFWNKAAESLYGWTSDEALGQPVSDLVVPESGREQSAAILQALSEGRPWAGEFTLRRRDGSTFDAYVTDTPVFDDNAELVGLIGVSTDISDLKAAQAAATARQRRMEAMADSLPALVGMASTRHGVFYLNRAWYEFSGLNPQGSPISWSDYVHEEDFPAIRDAFQTLLHGQIIEREARMRRHDGVFRWFLIRAVPLATTAGERGTAIITAVDITELKRAGQMVEEARKELATILQAIADGVVAQDHQGRLIYANDAAARLVGFASAGDMVAAPIEHVLAALEIEDEAGRHVPAEELPWRRALAGSDTEEMLIKFRGWDLEDRFSLVKASPVFDSGGKVQYAVSIFREITHRVEAEREREELLGSEHASRLAAEKATSRIGRLQAITARLAAVWSIKDAGQAILDHALDSLSAAAGAVATVDSDGRLNLLASRGYSDSAIEAWNRQPLNMARPFSDALATGSAVFVDSPDEFRQRYPEFAAAIGVMSQSSACIPLSLNGRTIGGLTLSFTVPNALGAVDKEFILSVAQQCSLAIARTQLYDAERSARTRAEDAEARYRVLAESIPQVVFTAFSDGQADYFSPQFFEFTGLTPSEARTIDWHDLLHPDDIEAVRETWVRSMESAEPLEVEARMRRADGSYSWVLERAVPLKDADDNVVRWLGTITDIDEQKRAQERFGFLAEASATLSSSLDYEETLRKAAYLAIPTLCDWCAMDVIDDSGVPSRLLLAGVDPKVVSAAEAAEIEEPISKVAPIYAEAIKDGQPVLRTDVDAESLRRMGMTERRLALLKRAGVRSAIILPIRVRGAVTAVISMLMGPSHRRYDERDLETVRDFGRHISFAVENALLYRESQRVQDELRLANEAKDEFLGLMSHELRTPITTLYGGAKILRSRGRFLDEEHRESLLRDIEAEAEGMHRMIEDLLTLARTGSGELVGTEPILANHLVDRVVRGFQLQKPGRQIVVRHDHDIPPVMADNTYLEQVLRNLLSNADKYSPPGQQLEVELSTENDEVVTKVLDRGSGIDPREAELIFTRFYRGERTARGVRGMGLGLTVCRKLVEAQGGRIWASPREGGGTEVAFALPAFKAGFDDMI